MMTARERLDEFMEKKRGGGWGRFRLEEMARQEWRKKNERGITYPFPPPIEFYLHGRRKNAYNL